MSFGFSVGDFVLAAEKGVAIYQKCATAPDQYKDLAAAVLVLRGNLERSRVFALAEHDKLKLDHQEQDIEDLVVARIASVKTLEKVDRFLDKHIKLDENVSKTLSLIDRAAARGKFLFSGIEVFLLALTSVSVSFICGKLDKIHADCRNEAKAKTVITAAVRDGERVDAAEILKQVQKDLVDEDVHPDAIDLQFDIIQRWANDVAESAALTESEDEDTTLWTWKDFEKSGFTAGGAPQAPKTAAKPSPGPASGFDDELYASSVAPRDVHLEPPTERGRSRNLMPPSERSLSRPSSLGSHQSQDSDWRPFQELSDEAQRYIQEILFKALCMEPFSDLMDMDTASSYFKRAFSQQDAYSRGYLTRNEATLLGQKAVEEVDINLSTREIDAIVVGYDDGNAKIEKDEFIQIMHDLRLRIQEELKIKWRRNFDEANARAQQKASEQRLAFRDEAEFLHWGFQRFSQAPDAGYLDIVEERELSARPPVLPAWSFTVMAYEVAKCVGDIDLAENEWWNKVLPDQHLRDQFHGTFRLIREVALPFAMFENRNDRSQRSDLDEMVSVIRLLGQTEGKHNVAGHPMQALCKARSRAYEIMQEVVGFAFVLTSGGSAWTGPGLKPLGKPTTAKLPEDLKKWNSNHMQSWAKLIGDAATSEWPDIEKAVLASRDWYEAKGSDSSRVASPKAKTVRTHSQTYSPSIGSSAKASQKSKQKSVSEVDLQSLASTSHGAPNKLAESAMFMASSHCRTLRTAEQADLEELRASPRRCQISNFTVEDVERGRLSFTTRTPKCVVQVSVGARKFVSPRAEDAVAFEPWARLPPAICSLELKSDSILRLEVVEMPKRTVYGSCEVDCSQIALEKDDLRKGARLLDKNDHKVGFLRFSFHGSPDPDSHQTLIGPHPWFSLFEDAFEQSSGPENL